MSGSLAIRIKVYPTLISTTGTWYTIKNLNPQIGNPSLPRNLQTPLYFPSNVTCHVECGKLSHRSTMHWRDKYASSDSILTISFSNLLVPGPGLRTLASPQTIHVLFPDWPRHHPPGTGLSGNRSRISWSIRSRTESSDLRCEAKAAPLATIASKLLALSSRGFSVGLKAAYCRLWLMTVCLN